MGKLDDLERLQKLKECGAITEEEFEIEKKKILNNDVEIVEDAYIDNFEETITEEGKEDQANIEKKINNKICSKCGNEPLKEDKFCCKGGNKVVNSNTENVSKNKEPIKIKFSHLIIGLILVIFMIVLVVTLSRNSGKSNIYNINGIDNEQANQQINNEEIDIKLYDVNNDKPSIIKLDNTTQTGAVYDFTIDDFKLALENVCKQNNIKYEENSNNNENYYGLIINLNSNTTIEISLILENNKIIGLVSSILDENSKNNLENKIISEIIEELFEENYANQIIKVENEILCDKYRYANSSLFIKIDLTSIALLQMKDEDEIDKHMQDWKLITQQLGMNLSIFIIMPTSEEYYKTFKEDLYKIKDKLNFMEDKEETIFKDSNSISYIKFTSNTEFEMMIGVEGSEAFSKSGTYRKNENTVIFNVTYDSELEPSDYNGITEPFSPYEMKINIKDENTLQYIDNYNTTYTFKKGIIDDEEDYSIKGEEKTDKNTTEKTDKNTTSKSSSSNKLQTKEPKKEWTYTHIALQGCVITSSDSKTGAVTYKKKCESCGTVEPGSNSTYISVGTLNSSFYCHKCKKTQKVQIEVISEYK